jgi:hypothetical protein
MSRNLIKPFFARPPAEYDQQYMATLVQSFALYLEQMQNPGEGRHTQLTLTDLPDSDQGLEVGALFKFNNFIKIASADNANLPGVAGTGAVGSVTVTT